MATLAYETAITVPAFEVMVGDTFNTNCGIGSGAWVVITRKTFEENNQPGQSDRVRLQWAGSEICPERTLCVSSEVEILPTGPNRRR